MRLLLSTLTVTAFLSFNAEADTLKKSFFASFEKDVACDLTMVWASGGFETYEDMVKAGGVIIPDILDATQEYHGKNIKATDVTYKLGEQTSVKLKNGATVPLVHLTDITYKNKPLPSKDLTDLYVCDIPCAFTTKNKNNYENCKK